MAKFAGARTSQSDSRHWHGKKKLAIYVLNAHVGRITGIALSAGG